MHQQPTNLRTILIIDDTPEDRATFRRYLERDPDWQYVFVEAEQGLHAAGLCRETKPDCILLDYHLPDINGLELLDGLKDAHKSDAHACGVVMLTAMEDLGIAIEAMKRGADDYLVKGRLTPEDLPLAVMKAIEKARLRRALDEQKRFFQVTLRSIGDAVIAACPAGRITFLNRAAAVLTGWDEDAALGARLEAVLSLTNDATREPIETPVARVLREGAIVALPDQTVLSAGDGREIPVDASCAPIRDELEQIVGVVLILQDSTLRRRSEEALRDSEERLKLSLEASGMGVWTWDPKIDRLYWSPEHYRIFGVADFAGTSAAYRRFLHPEDGEQAWQSLQSAIAHGTTYNAEFRIVRGDGEVRWILSRGRAAYDQAGYATRVFGIVQDISAAKRAEMEREELLQKETAARAEAQAASRAKDEFLALVSHELRSPLDAILGWLRVLRTKPEPEIVNKFAEIVERSAKTQYQLIEDLLDSARIMTGKMQFDVRPLDPVSVIRAAIETVRPAAEAKSIALHSSFLLDQEQITGDADRLQQVVWNLLSNAVKFTPAGGTVRVRVERADPHVRITVSDSGKGIKAELLPHVFERFWQGEESGGRKRLGGLGLGLSLVKQIVEMHGGAVEAESRGEGAGAVFTVHLPLRAVIGATSEAERGGQIEQTTPISVSLSSARVLVVDDEEDARGAVSATLEMFGAEVRAVATGHEAIGALSDPAWRPNILVLDIGLPDESGYQLLGRVRALPPEQGADLPAVALTAYGRLEDRVQALQAGFQMHVAKPVEPLELAITVASLLARRRQAMNAGD